jgi:hypothetical protein
MAVTVVVLTTVSYLYCGDRYINEAVLFHVGRSAVTALVMQ